MEFKKVMQGEIVRYEGKILAIGEVIGRIDKKGLFQIMEINKSLVTDIDLKEVYKDYKIGQQLEPILVVARTHSSKYVEREKFGKYEVIKAGLVVEKDEKLKKEKAELLYKLECVEDSFDFKGFPEEEKDGE